MNLMTLKIICPGCLGIYDGKLNGFRTILKQNSHSSVEKVFCTLIDNENCSLQGSSLNEKFPILLLYHKVNKRKWKVTLGKKLYPDNVCHTELWWCYQLVKSLLWISSYTGGTYHKTAVQVFFHLMFVTKWCVQQLLLSSANHKSSILCILWVHIYGGREAWLTTDYIAVLLH